MKKLVLLGLVSSFMFASTWTCYRYVDSNPTGGFVKVEAYSKYEAEKKALRKYREELKYKTDFVKCQ